MMSNEGSIGYLILAHDRAEQLGRLVRQLRFSRADIFVHIDAKVAIQPFEQSVGAGVNFIRGRVPVQWGDYSQVSATLLLIEAALQAARDYDYLVLLSGTDYPLRSGAEISRFFDRNRGANFIDCEPMPTATKPISRLTDYHNRPNFGGRIWGKFRRGLVKYGLASKRNYKAYLGSLQPYSGSCWWALTKEACVYIRQFVNENPRLIRFYETTYCPDEMFFQTILANSSFRETIRPPVTFTDWTDGKLHPNPINDSHVELFCANPALRVRDVEVLFCRKVLHAQTLDKLDQMLQTR
jgi:hypothetical protein